MISKALQVANNINSHKKIKLIRNVYIYIHKSLIYEKLNAFF